MHQALEEQLTSTSVNSVAKFAWEILRRAVLERKILLLRIGAAIVLVQIANGAAVLFIQGFLASLFANSQSSGIPISELVPLKVLNLLNLSSELTVPKTDVSFYVPLAIVSFGLLRALAGYWYNISQEEVAQRIARHHRESMFSAVLKLPFLSSAKRSPGDWMSVIMADATFLQTRFSDLLTGFVKDGFEIVGGVILLAFFSPSAAVCLVLLSFGIAWSMGRAGKRISYFAEAFQSELGVLAATVFDLRARFRYMKSQHGETFEKSNFARTNLHYLNMMTGSIFIRALITPLMEWFGFVVFASLIWGWTTGKFGGGFTPDDAMKFFAVLGLLLRPIRQMGEQVARLGETVGGLRRSMNLYAEVSKLSQTSVMPASADETEAAGFTSKKINLKAVSVSYEERRAFYCEQVSISPGIAIAVVGQSGSGKSSFLKCLAGVIPPSLWQSEHSWERVSRASAFVSQTPFMFSATLRDNLTYGLDLETKLMTTDEMLRAALRIVGLEDVVRKLGVGLESEFNPLSSNLSGGQLQRFVIARALLRRKPLLLLDEATSAVDGATEKELLGTLVDTVHEAHTQLIAVTHHVANLDLFDEIWYVANGQIILRGSHKELLEKSVYANFCRQERLQEPAGKDGP